MGGALALSDGITKRKEARIAAPRHVTATIVNSYEILRITSTERDLVGKLLVTSADGSSRFARDDEIWDQLIIRNDGPTAVVIQDVQLGTGAESGWVVDAETGATVSVRNVDPLKPFWPKKRCVPLQGRRLLPPGSEVSLPLDPEGEDPHENLTVPEVRLVDIQGRIWVICEGRISRAPFNGNSTWLGRKLEGYRWFPAFEAKVEQLASRLTKFHPRHASPIAWVANHLWGWRCGVSRDPFPLGLPSSWRYDELIRPYDPQFGRSACPIPRTLAARRPDLIPPREANEAGQAPDEL